MTFVDSIDIEAVKLRKLLREHMASAAAKLAQVETALLKIMREKDCLLEEAVDLLPDELAFFEISTAYGDIVVSSLGAILHHPMTVKKNARNT